MPRTPKKKGQQLGPTGCKLSKMSGSKILRRAASNLKNISIFGSNFIGNFRVPSRDLFYSLVTEGHFSINLWQGVMFSLTQVDQSTQWPALPVSKCFVSDAWRFLPVPPRGSIHKSHGLRKNRQVNHWVSRDPTEDHFQSRRDVLRSRP